MFLMGLGALLVLVGVVYMARAAIWRGSLSRPAGDTLEPPRRGIGFLGFRANWPGILLMAIGAVLLISGGSFCRRFTSDSVQICDHKGGGCQTAV